MIGPADCRLLLVACQSKSAETPGVSLEEKNDGDTPMVTYQIEYVATIGVSLEERTIFTERGQVNKFEYCDRIAELHFFVHLHFVLLLSNLFTFCFPSYKEYFSNMPHRRTYS